MHLGPIPARCSVSPDRFQQDIVEARTWAGKSQRMRSQNCKMHKALIKNREKIRGLKNPFEFLNLK